MDEDEDDLWGSEDEDGDEEQVRAYHGVSPENLSDTCSPTGARDRG
jgi:hypothetical protein